MERGLKVRAVEYQVIACDLAEDIGLSPVDVKTHFGDGADLAVVKCADVQGRKYTAITEATRFKKLLDSGEARQVEGMTLLQREWPIVFRGGLQAS